MRRLPALFAALLLPAAQPLLLVTALSTATLLVSEAAAQAQSQEAVGKVAQAITVRIEGATQGSGVLVKRDGNRYTVLTAWHVVSGQRAGEELDIYTSDGQRHPVEQGSIKQLGKVDMAVLTFSSQNTYMVSVPNAQTDIESGSNVCIAGYKLDQNIRRVLNCGKLVANATVGLENGYQLLYRARTSTGMSGGAVLGPRGELIGIHGRGQRRNVRPEEITFDGPPKKTDINEGVPIHYYAMFISANDVLPRSTKTVTHDDFIALAMTILGQEGMESWVIKITNDALSMKLTATGYFFRGYALAGLRKYKDAISDYNRSIDLDPSVALVFYSRGYAKSEVGDLAGAIEDYTKSLNLDQNNDWAYTNRGQAKFEIGDYMAAISDYNRALLLDPLSPNVLTLRGLARFQLNDAKGAIADFNNALVINPKFGDAYFSLGLIKLQIGEHSDGCKEILKAKINGSAAAARFRSTFCH